MTTFPNASPHLPDSAMTGGGVLPSQTDAAGSQTRNEMSINLTESVSDEIRSNVAKAHAAARRKNEAQFESLLRSYIVDSHRQFSYGGLVNLLTSIAAICEEQSQRGNDDWQKAAALLEDCARACDLRYWDEP